MSIMKNNAKMGHNVDQQLIVPLLVETVIMIFFRIERLGDNIKDNAHHLKAECTESNPKYKVEKSEFESLHQPRARRHE